MGRYLKVVPGRGINTSQAFDEVYLVNNDGTPWTPDNPADVAVIAIRRTADAGDTAVDVTSRLEFTDTPLADGSVINIEHWGDGTNGYNGQTFGLDIHNNPGASIGFVFHQYSNTQGLRLDNTGTGAMLNIVQTNNPVRNPESVEGTAATGDAIRVIDFNGVPWFRVLGRGEVVLNPPADAVGSPLEIVGNAASNKKLLRLTMNNPQVGQEILVNAGAAGAYPLSIIGQNYGPLFSTSTNGGQTLRVLKQGTGNGEAAMIINQGTSATLSLRTASATEVARVNPDGELENITAGKGHLMRSPDGTRYRLAVANGGTVSVVAA